MGLRRELRDSNKGWMGDPEDSDPPLPSLKVGPIFPLKSLFLLEKSDWDLLLRRLRRVGILQFLRIP